MKRNSPSAPSRQAENQFTDRIKFGMKLSGLGSEKQNQNFSTFDVHTTSLHTAYDHV
jgi:hypothetical protein